MPMCHASYVQEVPRGANYTIWQTNTIVVIVGLVRKSVEKHYDESRASMYRRLLFKQHSRGTCIKNMYVHTGI